MTTPKLIKIQTAPPRGSFPGATAEAYYVIDNKKVTLTDRDGTAPILKVKSTGARWPRTTAPIQVAALLLRSLRTKVRGDRVAGFDRPLVYPKGWGVPC